LLEPGIARRLEADAKYSVYLDRQDEDVARFRKSESILLPADLDYAGISGLSSELRQKFLAIRPSNIGQAGRIEGMTPAALALVAARARRGKATFR
jgi:tRNA uridine 5-carboxymethylaminomethyl modification enzyme